MNRSPVVIKHTSGFRWKGLPILSYKEEGTHFKEITRQILFEGTADLPCQLRYFEVQAGGYSTLEHHEHHHVVLIVRGRGRALVGDRVVDIGVNDIVHIPSYTWHQFQATHGEVFGFLCIVHIERDRPIRPSEQDLAAIKAKPEVAGFIKV